MPYNEVEDIILNINFFRNIVGRQKVHHNFRFLADSIETIAKYITDGGGLPPDQLGRLQEQIQKLIDEYTQREHLGTFEEGRVYLKGNSVTYNGSSYRAIKDSNGTQDPTNTEYWILEAAAGTPGVMGERGEDGKGINLGTIYSSYQELVDDKEKLEENTLYFIVSGPGQPNNGELYALVNNEITLFGELEGLQGPRGEQGETGPQGPIGPRGEVGPQGAQGPKGFDGEIGPQGPPGRDGAAGIDGKEGPRGERGERGPEGPEGPRGVQGERGEKGERGQGLDIKKSYQTLALANADISNIEDSTFVYVSNDENNENRGTVYFKHEGATELEFQFVAEGIRGEKGETGERGLQGERGPQGVRGTQGVPGQPGERGPQGYGVKVLGIKNNEGELSAIVPNSQLGDAYWIDGVLYVFTDDPRLVAAPTFLRSPSLIGPQGTRGPVGPQGPAGETPQLLDATKNSKGVVQVGDGLNVNQGVISTSTKHYLRALNTTGEFINGNQVRPSFNVISNGINYNSSNGFFTLTPGKVYKVEYQANISTSGYINFRLQNSLNQYVDTHLGVWSGINNARSSCSYVNIVVPTEGNTDFRLVVNDKNSDTANLVANTGILLVTEI